MVAWFYPQELFPMPLGLRRNEYIGPLEFKVTISVLTICERPEAPWPVTCIYFHLLKNSLNCRTAAVWEYVYCTSVAFACLAPHPPFFSKSSGVHSGGTVPHCAGSCRSGRSAKNPEKGLGM